MRTLHTPSQVEDGVGEEGRGTETQTGEEAAGADLPVCVPLF